MFKSVVSYSDRRCLEEVLVHLYTNAYVCRWLTLCLSSHVVDDYLQWLLALRVHVLEEDRKTRLEK